MTYPIGPSGCPEWSVWHGCYDDSWKGLIVDEAFAHPAKMSRALTRRIFDHAFARGWLARGSVVVDPFGGIGSTGIEAASRGCRAFLCELEEKFVGLARQNFALHQRAWAACGDPMPVIVQGDSRRLCEVLGTAMADCVVSSPPYTEEVVHGRPSKMTKGIFKGRTAATGLGDYGRSPGQLGAMPAGSVDAVVSSQPYTGDVHLTDMPNRFQSHRDPAGKPAAECRHDQYGSTPGNLGNLPTGQIADCIVSSPPYEGNRFDGGESSLKKPQGFCKGYSKSGGYGDNSGGQLGNDTGETFWTAAREIVQQCYQILRPGGVAIWVCKDFVRAKKRVPFSADWLRLCEACGFEPLEWIKASLVKEQRHPDLFGGEDHVKKTERKSFFRRLAEGKGSPRIDEEDVIIVSKPLTQRSLLT